MTDALLLVLVVELAVLGVVGPLVLTRAVTRLLHAIQAEVAPQWSELPHPVTDQRPTCGHSAPLTHRHSTGATACAACAAV